MEDQLRRGAALCRRMAIGALVVGFVGSIVIAAGFGAGAYGDGLHPQAFLSIMLASILGLALAFCLFFMVARTMEGLADLIVRTAQPSVTTAIPATAQTNGQTSSGRLSFSLSGPGQATLSQPGGKTVIGQLTSIKEVTEHIRMGHFVKVTTSDGVTGWIRDTDLPPVPHTPGLGRAGPVPGRSPRPIPDPGVPAGRAPGQEGLSQSPAVR